MEVDKQQALRGEGSRRWPGHYNRTRQNAFVRAICVVAMRLQHRATRRWNNWTCQFSSGSGNMIAAFFPTLPLSGNSISVDPPIVVFVLCYTLAGLTVHISWTRHDAATRFGPEHTYTTGDEYVDDDLLVCLLLAHRHKRERTNKCTDERTDGRTDEGIVKGNK